MVAPVLIRATLHVEVQLSNSALGIHEVHASTRARVADFIQSNYDTVNLGKLDNDSSLNARSIVVADYTGPPEPTGHYSLAGTALDVQTYVLRSEDDKGDRRSIKRDSDNEGTQARIIALPNVALNDDWDSLVFDDGLPSRLLRYLVRMVGMMGQPGLNLATFNWNKICLLHGPPGSGKSTLCRALAQKLSIRLGDTFPKATLVEINANAMLSKYFGESGKLIESTFDKVQNLAKDHTKLVVVVIDEVETIASSRQRVSSSGECSDGLRVSVTYQLVPRRAIALRVHDCSPRTHMLATDNCLQATNQLLTALDRLRGLPNILVCCTSNLVGAIVSNLRAYPRNLYRILITITLLRIRPFSTALISSNMCPLHLPQQSTTSSAAASTSSQGAACSLPEQKADRPMLQTR